MIQLLEKEVEVEEFVLPRTKTIAEEALRIIQSRPADKFTSGLYFREDKACAVGAWGSVKYPEKTRNFLKKKEFLTYGQLCSEFILYTQKGAEALALTNFIRDAKSTSITAVNDGEVKEYQQVSIKERNIAFLKDIIAIGF